MIEVGNKDYEKEVSSLNPFITPVLNSDYRNDFFKILNYARILALNRVVDTNAIQNAPYFRLCVSNVLCVFRSFFFLVMKRLTDSEFSCK